MSTAEERRAAAAERQAAARADREADANRARDYKFGKGVIKDVAPLADAIGRGIGALKGLGGTSDQAEGTREAAGHRAMTAAEIARQRREAVERGDVSGHTDEDNKGRRGGRDANSARGGDARPSAAEQLVEAVAEARRSGKQSDIDRAVDIAGRMRDSNGNYSIPRQTIYVPREVGDGSEPRFGGGAKANSPEALVEAVSRGIKGVPGHEIIFQRDRAAQPAPQQRPVDHQSAPAQPSQDGYVKTALHVDGAPATEKQTLPSLEQVVRGVAAAKARGEFGPEERESVKRTLQLIEQQNGGIDFPDHHQRVSRQAGISRREYHAEYFAAAQNNRGMDTGVVPAGATDTAKVRFSGTQNATADAALAIIENSLDKAGIGKKPEVQVTVAPPAAAPAAPAKPAPADDRMPDRIRITLPPADAPAARPDVKTVPEVAMTKAEGGPAKLYPGTAGKLWDTANAPKVAANQVKEIQAMLGVKDDGKWGPVTQDAFAKKCKEAGISPKEVDFTNPRDPELLKVMALLNKDSIKQVPDVSAPAAAPVLEASAKHIIGDSPERHAMLQALAAARGIQGTDEQIIAYGDTNSRGATNTKDGKLDTAELATLIRNIKSEPDKATPQLVEAVVALAQKEGVAADGLTAAPAPQRVEVATRRMTDEEKAAYDAQQASEAPVRTASVASGMTLAQSIAAQQQEMLNPLGTFNQPPAAEPAPAPVAAAPAPATELAPAAATAPAPEPQPAMVAAAFNNVVNSPAFAAMPAVAAAGRESLFATLSFDNNAPLPTPDAIQVAMAQAKTAVVNLAAVHDATVAPPNVPNLKAGGGHSVA